MDSEKEEITIYASCSWCAQPGASHLGGVMTEDGEDLRGQFCNRRCFDLWASWKRTLHSKQNNKKEVPAPLEKKVDVLKRIQKRQKKLMKSKDD